MAVYPKGQSVRLAGTYEGADGLVTEPSSAVLRVRRPSGVVVVYSYLDGTLERVGDGEYAAVVQATSSGRWLYEFTGTGQNEETPAKMSYFDVMAGF